MAKNLHNRVVQVVHRGVPGFVCGCSFRVIAFNVFGADSRSNKNEFVLKVAAIQNFGGHRIEKGFGQFGLKVIDQQPDVMQFHLLPNVG